jgi:hypothetical protein
MASLKNTVPKTNNDFTIRNGSLSLFVAMSYSGKTYLQRYLLHKLMHPVKNYKWIHVVSPTKFNKEWTNVVGDDNVSEEFDTEKIEDLLDYLSFMAEEEEDYPGLLILDDCMGSIDWQSRIITRLASTGRHYAGLTIWASFQYYFKIPTVMRENAAYLFMLNQVNVKVAKKLLEEKANLIFKNAEELKEHINKETADYGCVIICTHDRNRPILTIRAPQKETKYTIKTTKPEGV